MEPGAKPRNAPWATVVIVTFERDQLHHVGRARGLLAVDVIRFSSKRLILFYTDSNTPASVSATGIGFVSV